LFATAPHMGPNCYDSTCTLLLYAALSTVNNNMIFTIDSYVVQCIMRLIYEHVNICPSVLYGKL